MIWRVMPCTWWGVKRCFSGLIFKVAKERWYWMGFQLANRASGALWLKAFCIGSLVRMAS